MQRLVDLQLLPWRRVRASAAGAGAGAVDVIGTCALPCALSHTIPTHTREKALMSWTGRETADKGNPHLDLQAFRTVSFLHL
ncbi:hypothetical protein Q5P01_013790 [Channa striata]|uniref:Uncharacterized protein n=1 Tax=Channa striata TaxID=64152 RepID=A0AA88MNH0_CHASR|nr:hypothetical protein Q5P01_013790 [Channa striata]